MHGHFKEKIQIIFGSFTVCATVSAVKLWDRLHWVLHLDRSRKLGKYDVETNDVLIGKGYGVSSEVSRMEWRKNVEIIDQEKLLLKLHWNWTIVFSTNSRLI